MRPGENALLKKFLLEYSKLGSRIFRNNVGMGWTGKTDGPVKETKRAILKSGDIVLRNARPFHAGFPRGSSDLVGWTQVTVTPDMVGRKLAIFTAIEAKTKNVSATPEQKNFIRTVKESGGIGVIAREFKDVLTSISIFTSGGNNGSKARREMDQ